MLWRNRGSFVLAVALMLVVWLTTASVSPALAMGPRLHCKICRRFIDTSPATMQTAYRFNKRVVGYKVCSLFCYFEFIEDFPEHEPEYIRALNYSSLQWEFTMFANAKTAYYLYGIEGDVEKTHEPYTAAFQSEPEAKKAQEELGGELMRWEMVTELVTELTDEYEPVKPGPKHKPNRRPGR